MSFAPGCVGTDDGAGRASRGGTYADAAPGDVLEVRIGDLHPTQAAIGYDQVYYRLARWQPDLERSTWRADPVRLLEYFDRTLGNKIDDYCEDTGQGSRLAPFATLAEAQAVRLNDPSTFACIDAPGTHTAAMKTVVVGWDGTLYLTDGHHSFSAFREVPDGGPALTVWVKVDANYGATADRKAFWQRLVADRRAWLRDGNNRAITIDQMPTRLGLVGPEPGGMADDPYRSLVYFTRSIGYTNAGLPEFAEFLWADWLRGQVAAGRLKPLDAYHLRHPPAAFAEILAFSTFGDDLQPEGSHDSYVALVRDAALLMASLAETDVVFHPWTAADLSRMALAPDSETAGTRAARDLLEELPRSDQRDPGAGPRTAGRLWLTVHYRTCGAPAPGTCWGW